MFDNGLLKKYKLESEKDGMLRYQKMREGQTEFAVQNEYNGLYYSRVKAIFMNNQKYFVKNDVKGIVDAEVLLSQIYAKAGFKTAIYTPITDEKEDELGVISNDVTTPCSKLARVFYTQQEDCEQCSQLLLPKSKATPSLFHSFFTKEGMRNYLKMQLFDIASFNTDRHEGNYKVELNKDEKITDVLLYDYGMSGLVTDIFYCYPIKFYNHFVKTSCKSKEELVEVFKTNEYVLDDINLPQMAEELGGIDVIDTSKDIAQTIGYEVNQDYADTIAKSFESLANDLIK